MLNKTTYHPQYITCTILEWKKLLKPEKYKQLIVDSLSYLVKESRVVIYAFVIMDNHMHIIWQMKNDEQRQKLQNSLLRYTAQKIKLDLEKNHPKVLEHFKVDAKDRTYQFWERNSLSIDLFSPEVFKQKFEYLHNNPVRAGLYKYPEEYYFSSASFYYYGKSAFDFLTHYNE
jgi:putative transposase